MSRGWIVIFCLLASLRLVALPSFDAVMQIGGTSTWETALYKDSAGSGSPDSSGNYSWSSGSPLSWKLSFDSKSSTLTLLYNLSGSDYKSSISEFTSDSVLNALQLTISTGNVSKSSSVAISNLVLTTNKNTYKQSDFSVSGSNQSSQSVFNVPVTGDFILTGQTTFSWGSSKPTGSSLSFSINAGSLPIPEPATLLSLTSMVAISNLIRRKK